MIETLYSLDALQTPVAFLLAFLIGLGFGTALEQAGFGSSRRLSAIFYFTDMTVLKVMFSAVITAMLGLSYCFALGILKPEDLNLLETILGAQVIGGLLFGIGFVMGGWCPGTAAVGVASGRIDALVFLMGAMLGSLVFNESFPLVKNVANLGNCGVLMVYDVLGVTRPLFAFGFAGLAIISFWGSELIEEYQGKSNWRGRLGSLILVTIGFLVAAGGLFLPIPSLPGVTVHESPVVQVGHHPTTYQSLLETVSQGEDHIEPEDLAQRLIVNESGLLVVDTRSAAEFNRFHIRSAVNIPLQSLFEGLIPFKNRGMIVLYSTGMTHPAQARDLLHLQGFDNVYNLTDGINGFITRCLKPTSVRDEPTSQERAHQISLWRNYFLASGNPPRMSVPPPAARTVAPSPVVDELPGKIPGLVEPEWVQKQVGKPGMMVIDTRPQPEYNSGHVPGAVSLNPENLRGMVGGVPSMLLPTDMLARQFSFLGLQLQDMVVVTYGEKLHDATLVMIALERLGHRHYALLHGGHARWVQKRGALSQELPSIEVSAYQPSGEDAFTISIDQVALAVQKKSAVILDVRLTETFTGKQQDEARGGHIPGALNHPFTEDVLITGDVQMLKEIDELGKTYGELFPDKSTPIIVHCRTGHQASQAYFVLKHLLGYTKVRWYDGGWTEWATRKEQPVITGP